MIIIRRDTWSCCALFMIIADRILKIIAEKGSSFNIGPLLYSIAPTTEILGNVSVRERAFILMPPIMLLFWFFSKCGGLKPRLWSMLFLAGMAGFTIDVLMRRGIQDYFSLAIGGNYIIFSLASIYLILGVLIGIYEMVMESMLSEC